MFKAIDYSILFALLVLGAEFAVTKSLGNDVPSGDRPMSWTEPSTESLLHNSQSIPSILKRESIGKFRLNFSKETSDIIQAPPLATQRYIMPENCDAKSTAAINDAVEAASKYISVALVTSKNIKPSTRPSQSLYYFRSWELEKVREVLMNVQRSLQKLAGNLVIYCDASNDICDRYLSLTSQRSIELESFPNTHVIFLCSKDLGLPARDDVCDGIVQRDLALVLLKETIVIELAQRIDFVETVELDQEQARSVVTSTNPKTSPSNSVSNYLHFIIEDWNYVMRHLTCGHVPGLDPEYQPALHLEGMLDLGHLPRPDDDRQELRRLQSASRTCGRRCVSQSDCDDLGSECGFCVSRGRIVGPLQLEQDSDTSWSAEIQDIGRCSGEPFPRSRLESFGDKE